ncbi:MAG TPA: heparinase II/III family protein [Terracidiphilus sp.]|nr:heparinase II/III family protein [Terracidiphilus sp.]
MNRRDFLAGTIALAGQQKLLRSMGALHLDTQNAAHLVAPHNLLSTTYTESFLESKLVACGAWHPYPTWSERAPWEAVPADIRAAIVERAEADRKAGWKALLATTFLDFKRNGNRSRYEADNFGRRSMLQQLVLAECLEGKGRFVDDISNGVWLVCEETFWGAPAHLAAQKAGVGLPDVTEPIIELFSAETAQMLSWITYLLGPQLDAVSPLINKRIRIETERRMLKPARERNDFTWMGLGGPSQEHRLNNWCPWINSNLLVTNLLLEEDPKLRVMETVRIAKSVDTYLNDYWPDAGEEEGPGYYSRSVMCLFEVLSTLESATGNSTGILANPFIDAMGRFILNVHIANDDYVDYGDVHGKAAPSGDVLYRFGKAVHDPQLQAFGAFYAAKSGWNAQGAGLTNALNENLSSLSRSLPAVLEANEIRAARQEDVLVRDAWYPEFGLMTAREKAGTTAGMYVAVLASNNGRSHSHNDTGNFVIYQDGQPVTIDVGVETYTAKTFSPQRYTIWTMQSAYHNLPTVGGVMQHNGVEFQATDRKYSTDDERATVSFNIATAYPKEAGIKSWIRTVTLDRVRNRVVVEEDFELANSVPITLSVMTPRIPTAGGQGGINMALASGDGKAALLKFDGAVLSPDIEKIALTDVHLREDWGEQIYRILLKSQPVAKGKWSYEFGAA